MLRKLYYDSVSRRSALHKTNLQGNICFESGYQRFKVPRNKIMSVTKTSKKSSDYNFTCNRCTIGQGNRKVMTYLTIFLQVVMREWKSTNFRVSGKLQN